MNDRIEQKLTKYNDDLKALFLTIREIIYHIGVDIDEVVWAGLPSYYHKDNFIRLIPFKDYVNIEAKAIKEHIKELSKYKLTPKGMLRLEINQVIPSELIKTIFKETLNGLD